MMQDPLNINIPLEGIDTNLPLLPAGDYQVQCSESTVAPNKDKVGLNWNLKLPLVNAATAVDGRTVNPDFPLFAIYALQAREDSKDPEAFKRGLSEAIDALYGTDKTNRPAMSQEVVTGALGKQCIATVVIDEYQGVKNNKIRRLKPLK